MPFRTALRAPRAAATLSTLARRLTTGRACAAAVASRCFTEPLEDRRLLSVNILTPVKHAAEGNRVGFFADYTAGSAHPRPASGGATAASKT